MSMQGAGGSMMLPGCCCLQGLSGRKYKTVCEPAPTPGPTKRGEEDEALRITDAWAKITAQYTQACKSVRKLSVRA